jgi:hypothetical protein
MEKLIAMMVESLFGKEIELSHQKVAIHVPIFGT